MSNGLAHAGRASTLTREYDLGRFNSYGGQRVAIVARYGERFDGRRPSRFGNRAAENRSAASISAGRRDNGRHENVNMTA